MGVRSRRSGISIVFATAGAAAARIGVGLDSFRASVGEGRRSVRRTGRPLWQRLYLDVLALVVAGLVYWLTVRTGFSAVVNPDSNPTLSLSVYMFLAPALLWLGAALLLIRLRGRLVAWSAARIAGARATTPAGFLLASAGRRGPAINRGLLVLGLLLAFSVNLGIFSATYEQQARVDAQLTLGADVVARAPAGAITRGRLLHTLARLPGAAGVSAVDHTYAYVGPDLQDTFGIDPSTLTRGTTLRDSYFLGGSAAQMLDRLRYDRATGSSCRRRRSPITRFGRETCCGCGFSTVGAAASASSPSTWSGSCRSSRRRRRTRSWSRTFATCSG